MKTLSSPDRATAYALAVVDGEIVAGPHVRNACRRHLDDLKSAEDRGFYWDVPEVEKTFEFFEGRLRLSEGQFEGRPFQLHPSQCFIVGSIFGWRRISDNTRRFRRAYIEQGKGNGKSPLAGGIGLKGLCADDEPGAEIYAAAARKEQAAILFRDAVKMVRKSPALDKRIRSSGGMDREFNLSYLKNASFFRPISREAGKTGSGPRPHMALCDEVHEHPDGSIMEMLERGFKFRRQPLLLMITNSGSDRTSVCWEEHMHAVRVASGNPDAKEGAADYLGEVIDDTTFSYVCALDEDDNPLTDPSCHVKANPLLGVTITAEYLQGVVDQALALPSRLNNILRLHFCRWTDSETAWMSRAALEPCLAQFEPEEHHGKKVYLGIDLSEYRDMTAKAYCVESGVVEEGQYKGRPVYDVWIEAWTPLDTMDARDTRDKTYLRLWSDQGFLTSRPGEMIDYRDVAESLYDDDRNFEVVLAAYDRYKFRSRLEPHIMELGLSLPFVEHPQGGVRKGKPTEAMKDAAESKGVEAEGLWMPSSKQMFEQLVYEKRVRIRHNPVTISAIMSAVEREDRWNNTWIEKDKSSKKHVDAAVAICMAVGAATLGGEVEPEQEYSIHFV